LTDYLNVFDAERQEFDLEEQYVATQRTAAEQLVKLYKALVGGGSFMNSYRRSGNPGLQSSHCETSASTRRSTSSLLKYCEI
jgi:hypothetical protein